MREPDYESSTLCWDCANAYGKCSWSDRLEPVEGWTAIETKVRWGEGNTYNVRKCPQFIRDTIYYKNKPHQIFKDDEGEYIIDEYTNAKVYAKEIESSECEVS